jgi:hypothetical protein
VNVTGAALNRREEQRVGEPDDRRFAALLLERGRVDLFGAVNDLDFFLLRVEVQVLERAVDRLHRLATRRGVVARRGRIAEVLGDGFTNRGVGRDDGLDVQAGAELDVVHREDVGGIRHRERERVAIPRDRNDVVFRSRVARDQSDDVGIELEVTQVDRRYAVLPAEEVR